MPIAYYDVLEGDFIGVLNILTDEEGSIVKSEEDEQGFREIIRRHVKPWYKQYTEASAQIYKDTLRYYLTTNEIDFDDIWGQQQDADIPTTTDPRDFFVWIWEELFPGENYEISDLSDWSVNKEFSNVLRCK